VTSHRPPGAAHRLPGTPASRRRGVLVSLVPVGVVALVAAILVAVHAAKSEGTITGHGVIAAPSDILAKVTAVPPATLDKVGAGTLAVPPTRVTGPPLTASPLPRVLYVGAEYCPYCAAERWALIVALARFGRFAGLGQTESSPTEVFPNTATFTFHNASYASSLVSFTGKEVYSNQVTGSSYAALDSLDPADARLWRGLGNSNLPFIDIGGRYMIGGASFNPQVLQGKSQADIADALADASTAVAKGVDGTANVIAAGICDLTKGNPASVCDTPAITAGKAGLDG
jgi:hypothetical protein